MSLSDIRKKATLKKLSQWLIGKQQQRFVELCINSSFIKGSISYVEWTRLVDIC